MGSRTRAVAVLAVAGALLGAAAVAHAFGTFGSPASFEVGHRPLAVAVGDFNRDSDRDLVATNFGASDLSVLIGNGDGTFDPAVAYTTGEGPTGVVATDVDGNGKTDLVTANNFGASVSVLRGRADGTFRAAEFYPAGQNPNALVVRDLDRDGDKDIAVANRTDDDVSVLANNGDGTFADHVDYGVGGDPQALVAGDFNRDGRRDLITSNAGDQSISLLEARRHGTFRAALSRDIGAAPNAASMVTGHFHRDGDLDLAIGVSSGDVLTLEGNGDGTFEDPLSVDAGTFITTLVVADVNNDGEKDLVGADQDADMVSVLRGKRDGGYRPLKQYATGDRPEGLVVRDLNHDHGPDIAVSLEENTVDVLDHVQVLLNLP